MLRALLTRHHVLERLEARRAFNRRYHTALKELRTLDERELNDLGIRRVDVPRLAREEARRGTPGAASGEAARSVNTTDATAYAHATVEPWETLNSQKAI